MVKPAETSDVPHPQTTSHSQIATEQQGKMSVLADSTVLETSRSTLSSIWQLLDLTASRLYFSAGQLVCQTDLQSFCRQFLFYVCLSPANADPVNCRCASCCW